MIYAIAATDINGGIAKNRQIPWSYKQDFHHFKTTTENGIVIVGRNTYEEIIVLTKGKGLVGRDTYVLTSNTTIPNSVQSYQQIEDLISVNQDKNIFFAGGEDIFYRAVETYAAQVLRTVINKDFKCTEYFPMGSLRWYFDLTAVTPLNDPDLSVWSYTRKR